MNNLVVISIDALVSEDVEYLKSKPNFSKYFEKSASVETVKSIFPTLTYPCHVVQMTGHPVSKNGVINNEIFDVSRSKPEWTWDYNLIKEKTIFDYAKEAGLTTASFAWPVTAKATSIDYNFPEVWDMDRTDNRDELIKENASPLFYEKYYEKHIEALEWSTQPLFDSYVMSVAPDVIQNEKPNLTLIHLSAVDIARHSSGLFSELVYEKLDDMDENLGTIFEAIDNGMGLVNTNVVIMSDHGHLKVHRQLNLNIDFVNEGLIELDEKNNVVNYHAFVAGAGLSAYVYVKTKAKYEQVKAILSKYMNTPVYYLSNYYSSHESDAMFQLDGEFDFVIESNDGTSFSNEVTGRILRQSSDVDFTYAKTGHGHRPDVGIQPVFIGKGPAFKESISIPRATLLDEVPTFARILDLNITGLPGKVLEDLLK